MSLAGLAFACPVASGERHGRGPAARVTERGGYDHAGEGAGLVAAGLGGAGPAQAVAMIDRGDTVFDPSTNLEWLANANLADTNAFGVSGIQSDGRMTWTTAQAWIAAMNTANCLGHNDWRLPLTAQPDTTCGSSSDPGGGFPTQYYGYNCTGSELGDLFCNKLGGDQFESVLNTVGDTNEEIANLLLFGGARSGETVTGSTIQSSVYWSGKGYAPNPSNA